MSVRILSRHPAGLIYRAMGMWITRMSRVAISNSMRVQCSIVGFSVKKLRRFSSLDRLTVEGRLRATSRSADRRLKWLSRTGLIYLEAIGVGTLESLGGQDDFIKII